MDKQENRLSTWLKNIYYVGTLGSLTFIMFQAFYAKNSVIESSEWEKAKMTIENIENFNKNIIDCVIPADYELADKLWADFSDPEKFHLSEPLRNAYILEFNDSYEASKNTIRALEVFNSFAYPIIMGYASEEASFQNSKYNFQIYSSFIMPYAFAEFSRIGFHAKVLYRLWRIRIEKMIIDDIILSESEIGMKYLLENKEYLIFYEEADFSISSLKEHSKKLDKRLKAMYKEIEIVRKNSLK